jgi:hypothetical protein
LRWKDKTHVIPATRNGERRIARHPKSAAEASNDQGGRRRYYADLNVNNFDVDDFHYQRS